MAKEKVEKRGGGGAVKEEGEGEQRKDSVSGSEEEKVKGKGQGQERTDSASEDEVKVKGEGEEGKDATSEETPQTSQTSPTPSPAEPDWKDQYARLLADFDNFKKRTARDREDTYRFAEASILKDVLPTVDNLALALEHAKNKDDEFVKGVQLVYDTLLKSLKDHGAEPFDCVGQPLDTEKMEAIATLPNAEVEEGKVSIESKRGWMLKDKVLRAAQVVVSSGKPEETK